MSCEELLLFADGELPPADSARFREHLATCAACQAGIEELVQLHLLEHASRKSAPAAVPEAEPRARGPRWDRGRKLRAAAVALAAAMALVVAGVLWPRAPQPLLLAEAPLRSLEPRLTHPGADGYRPYQPRAVMRGSGSSQDLLPSRTLARLEEARDFRGIAAVYLLFGYHEQAALALDRAGEGPDVDSDRAVVAFSRALAESGEGRWRSIEEALGLTERVLAARPAHPQALFNRALVLRELGLSLLAAKAFDRAAGLQEDGWAREARENAGALRAGAMRLNQLWRASDAAGRALMRLEGPLPFAAARDNPGLLRLYFYEAVRSATSAEQVRGLEPLAVELDRSAGGAPVLRDYVRAVAGRSFAVRGPLAQGYAQLARGTLPVSMRGDLLSRLRRSGENDILLGALVREPASVLPGELDALAASEELRRDPWLHLVLEQERAAQEAAQARWEAAERRLLEALDACGRTGLTFRCARLERRLVDVYVALHRPHDAHRRAASGLRLAREGREWKLERELLQELAQIAKLRSSGALAHAYLEESLLMDPDDCVQQRYVNEELAAVDMAELRIPEAREELGRALRAGEREGCRRPLSLSGALVLADLARFGGVPDDARHLREALDAVRAGPASPGERALATAVEGRFELERDRSRGQALLERALSEAEARRGDDVFARKARAQAYRALVFDAGKAGAFGEALGLLARELETAEVPARCVLGVVVEDERTLLVVRGDGGELSGRYDAGRREPLGRALDGLVPEDMLRMLRRCERVEVLAPPPVHGRAGLLPADFAWSYRVGAPRSVSALPAMSRHLVVADVKPPAELRLEPLAPYVRPAGAEPARVELTGDAATPSRVLAEMRMASEIELHAHGLLDPELSDASLLALSPDADGRYALTAGEVRRQRLEGAPLVVLAACEAAHTAPQLHEPYSLPAAFVQAGARVVLAATSRIPDGDAPRFFDAVRVRIHAGQPPAVATRDERVAWLARGSSRWVEDVLVFE